MFATQKISLPLFIFWSCKLQLAVSQQRVYLIIWSKGCLSSLQENIGQPYPLTSSVCTLPGGAPYILWNTIYLSLHFTNLDDKPSTQIVPYSSCYPVIPFTGTPNVNVVPGDYVTVSVFSKRATLFILSDSSRKNLIWLSFSSQLLTVCLTRSLAEKIQQKVHISV